MGELINLDGTPARSSREPDPTVSDDQDASEAPEMPDGMILGVLMACPRCHAQVLMQARPILLAVRADGVLMAAPQDDDEIVGQAFVVGLNQPTMRCPQCTGSGLVVPGGMPGGLPPLGPRG